MVIKSLCRTNVATVEKGATLRTVAQLMQDRHVGSIVVVEIYEGKKMPVGIITDRDIALSVGSVQKIQDLKVDQIMQGHPILAKDTHGIFETLMKMKKNGVRRLPVVQEDGALCGIVSTDDILNYLADEVGALARISEAERKNEGGVVEPLQELA